MIYSIFQSFVQGKGKSSKKRRSSEFNDEEEQSKRQKTEDIPLAKKPITLLKPKPPRKKLAPIMDQMMDEDPNDTPVENTPNKKRNSKNEAIDYEDVYTRKLLDEKQKTSIQKLRQLQQNEISSNLDNGTCVQCCECNKWRYI